MTAGLRLGAPGVYRAAPPAGRVFAPVRLDIAGFVGVALRGPVDQPVAVTSWSDYQQRFGGFEGPAGPADRPDPGGPDRLLPYAVQAFFAQGGASTYVLRVGAPQPPDGSSAPDATAATARLRLDLGTAVEVAAADEGSWGNRLAVLLDYAVARPFRAQLTGDDLVPPPGVDVPAGSLLRVSGTDPPSTGEWRWASGTVERTTPGGTRRRVVPLDPRQPPAAAAPTDPGVEVAVEVLTATLAVDDGDPHFRRDERLTGLGLRADHPRFVVTTLATESLLIRAYGRWPDLLPPDPALRPVPAVRSHDGCDRWTEIDRNSFFDDGPADRDPLDERDDHRGVDAMGRVADIGLLCVPDLQWRWQGTGDSADPADPDPAIGRFEPGPCDRAGIAQAATAYAPPAAPPARLDPRQPADFAEMVDRQLRLVEVADLRRRFMALIDVPAGLPVGEIARWRARFDTTFAASYHPWLAVPRAGTAGSTGVLVPPSAFAAGITAGRERRLGLVWGPANELAAGAVAAADQITDAVHDELDLLGVNVYRAERDGLRLTAAHTLSSDPDYQQVSVRRLMTMLALTLDRQAQFLVFEPNTAALRDLLTHTLTLFLRGQFRRGAFAGDTEEQSFFVRCDDSVNPPSSVTQGRLIAEVGIAPTAPLEYLVLRVSQDTDGTVSVVADHD